MSAEEVTRLHAGLCEQALTIHGLEHESCASRQTAMLNGQRGLAIENRDR